MMGTFVQIGTDNFNPPGEINWKRRLNARLEEQGVELTPVGYYEGDKPVMQVTQDNTIIYVNQVADELDCVAIRYDQDEKDFWTWYFREKFDRANTFEEIAGVIGVWACNMTTLYPMEHVVQQYEKFNTTDISDSVPVDWIDKPPPPMYM